jgi:hypothetical protein
VNRRRACVPAHPDHQTRNNQADEHHSIDSKPTQERRKLKEHWSGLATARRLRRPWRTTATENRCLADFGDQRRRDLAREERKVKAELVARAIGQKRSEDGEFLLVKPRRPAAS